MSAITTHVLDTSLGRTAPGVAVRLDVQMEGKGWTTLAERVTDRDGRVRDFVQVGTRLDAGVYRLTFRTGDYFASIRKETFFPEAVVVFEIKDASQHYHVPLLVSPFGYSTYRGS